MCTWTGCGVEMGSKVQSVFSDIPLGCFVRGSSEPSRPICSGGSEVGIELGRRDLRTAVCKAGRDQRDIGGLGGQPSAQDALPKVHGSGHRREASRDRQEQTGSDIPAEGGGSVVPRPTYTSGQPHAGTWQAEQKHQAWWCREGSCTSSAYRLSRWPGEPQPGFIMPADPQPERHGSHPGAVGPVLADRGPWRGIV